MILRVARRMLDVKNIDIHLCLVRLHRVWRVLSVNLLHYWYRWWMGVNAVLKSAPELSPLLDLWNVRYIARDPILYPRWDLSTFSIQLLIETDLEDSPLFLLLVIELRVWVEPGGVRGVQKLVIRIVGCLNIHNLVALYVLLVGWEVALHRPMYERGIFHVEDVRIGDGASMRI